MMTSTWMAAKVTLTASQSTNHAMMNRTPRTCRIFKQLLLYDPVYRTSMLMFHDTRLESLQVRV